MPKALLAVARAVTSDAFGLYFEACAALFVCLVAVEEVWAGDFVHVLDRIKRPPHLQPLNQRIPLINTVHSAACKSHCY